MGDVTLTLPADLARLVALALRREARAYGYPSANARALEQTADALDGAAEKAPPGPEPVGQGDEPGRALDLTERGPGW